MPAAAVRTRRSTGSSRSAPSSPPTTARTMGQRVGGPARPGRQRVLRDPLRGRAPPVKVLCGSGAGRPVPAGRRGRVGVCPRPCPTHPLAVLPLKLWRPRWFDGVALAVGRDRARHRLRARRRRHRTAATRSARCSGGACRSRWSPTRLIRLGGARPSPRTCRGRCASSARWRRVRHPWWVTAVSALLGAASHLLWDLVTHPRRDRVVAHRPRRQ